MEIRKISITSPIKSDTLLVDDQKIIHRIKNVLRLKDGDKLILIDGSGFEYWGQIKYDENNIIFEVKKKIKTKKFLNKNLNIFIGFLKKPVMEDLIEKLAQLGVKKIIPLKTERTSFSLKEIPPRWQRLISKANEVSTWQNFTQIHQPLSLIEAISLAKKNNIFLADPQGELTLKQFKKITKKLKNINLFIGPEGGFSDKEIKLIKQNGGRLIKIPQNTFRSEIATLIFACNILYG
mgnify:CR=1 FL=1